MTNNALIIDNNSDNYKRLAALISDIGFEVSQACDFAGAIKYIDQNPFSIIMIHLDTIHSISDIDAILKKSKPYSIITLMGPETYSDVICQAIDLGVDDFFRTPFSDAIFKARSRNMISRINSLRDEHVRKLHSLIDFLPVMMVISDGQGKIRAANQAILNKFGKPIELVRGQLVGDLLSCKNSMGTNASCHLNCGLCRIAEMEREVATTGKRIFRKEVSYEQMKEGKPHRKSLKLSMAPLDYDNSKLVIINVEDVTFERNAFDVLSSTIDNLRKNYDESQDQVKISGQLADYLQDINNNLTQERNKLQMLFNNMNSGFFLFNRTADKKLCFAEANTKASEMFNKDLTKYFGFIMPEKDAYIDPKLLQSIKNVMDTGQSESFNLKSEPFNATYRISVYSPEPETAAVLINDISDEVHKEQENKMLTRMLKKQNIELDDKNVELKKAVETKNKFISIIAHDLKNPFNAINGLSELLIKRLSAEVDARSHEMAKIIHESAKGAYELLENLLVWARTQHNAIQFSPAMLDIYSVTAETINEIKVQAEKKHIMLFNQTENGDQIWADKHMFQTIIRNITSNAIKFTNEGGIIVIGSDKTDTHTIITIEDNGVGMTEETRQKLMTVSKNKSTKGTAGETGSGMGLLISKEFIDKHKGTVEVESELGMGTKFIITFPNRVDDDIE